MLKRVPFIQILTAAYIVCVAVYMIYNEANDSWKNYYWIVNKHAMLFALIFNYKKDKTEIEWMFINFLTVQTIIIIIYFEVGLYYFIEWMKLNDAVVYSFFVSSFVALLLMWYRAIRRVEKWGN